MIGVILTGHGHFATGMAAAIEQVIGEQEQFKVIDFTYSMTTDQLRDLYQNAIQELDDNDSIVFFTDLLGGSPFRIASLLATKNPKLKVITGTNLQMIVEMLLEKELTVEDFIEQALVCGKRGISTLSEQLNISKKSLIDIEGEGI